MCSFLYLFCYHEQMVFEPCKGGKSWMIEDFSQWRSSTSSQQNSISSTVGRVLDISVVRTLESKSNRDILGLILKSLKVSRKISITAGCVELFSSISQNNGFIRKLFWCVSVGLYSSFWIRHSLKCSGECWSSTPFVDFLLTNSIYCRMCTGGGQSSRDQVWLLIWHCSHTCLGRAGQLTTQGFQLELCFDLRILGNGLFKFWLKSG